MSKTICNFHWREYYIYYSIGEFLLGLWAGEVEVRMLDREAFAYIRDEEETFLLEVWSG